MEKNLIEAQTSGCGQVVSYEQMPQLTAAGAGFTSVEQQGCW